MDDDTSRRMGTTSRGFTIVELLIVVVVIAILAAITIVAYTGVQNQANDATVKADMNAIAKKLELFKIDNGRYPITAAEMPADFAISKPAYDVTQNNAYFCHDKANSTYAFGGRSKSQKGYIVTSSGLREGVTVNGMATCNAIDRPWDSSNPDLLVIQGYNILNGVGAWTGGWNWVK